MAMDAEFLDGLREIIEKGQRPTVMGTGTNTRGPLRERVFLTGGRDMPKDITAELLSVREQPPAKRGTVKTLALPSFIAFTLRMARPHSVVFADKTKPSITAIFDYHEEEPLHPAVLTTQEAEAATDTANGTAIDDLELVDDEPVEINGAHWARFRASYEFPYSRQYKAWSSVNRKELSQAALAEFLEDNVVDLIDPALAGGPIVDVAKLLGLKLGTNVDVIGAARGLQLTSTENVTQAVNTTTGESQIAYGQTHEAMKTQTIPGGFAVAIPIFEGGDAYRMLVRLKFRKRTTDGRTEVKWTLDIYQMDRAVDDAFTLECDAVGTAVGLPLFYGEAPSPTLAL